MNILYCGDSAICEGVLLSTISIAENTDSELNVYILTAGLTNCNYNKSSVSPSFSGYLERVLKKYNINNSVKLIDITNIFSNELPSANLQTRFTPFCMLRLYADMVIEIPERVLYLDNDTICMGDMKAFYEQSFDGCDIAGVLDYYGSWFFRQNIFKRDYLNSGVLLINMNSVREKSLFEKCRSICNNEKMFMPDQTALNKVCKKKICPGKFNEQRKTRKDTVLRHFTTTFRFFPFFHSVSVKPWNVDGMHNVLKTHEFDSLLKKWQIYKNEFKESEQKNEAK